MEWLKKNIVGILILMVFIFLAIRFNGCKGGYGGGAIKPPDTVFTSHTEYVQQPVSTTQYVPIQSGTVQPIIIPAQYKADTSFNGLLRQYIELTSKYFSKINYSDSLILKDSTGIKVGAVKMEDQISENKFVNRKLSYYLNLPFVTNTVTITKYPLPKWQIYVGGAVEGGQKQLLTAAGLGIIYKSRRDAIWLLNAKYNFQQSAVTYEIGRYWKLNFKL